MDPINLRPWPVALLILLSHVHTTVANAAPLFDQTKRAVLPAAAATTILKWYVPDRAWTTSEWPITSAALDQLEVVLAPALAQAGLRQSSYRQYMPARWKRLHLIVVNGFYQSASDLFPDKAKDPDQWKHELLTVFGGGCGFWRAIYIVEQNRMMVLQNQGGPRSTVICNGPK